MQKRKFLVRLGQFNFGESYTSLLLGLMIVIAIAFTFLFFTKRNKSFNENQPRQDITSDKTERFNLKQKSQNLPSTYIVESGDTLWSIAEKTYKSGYNWVDIAKVNNLENADMLSVGTILKLPKVETKTIIQNNQNDITSKSVFHQTRTDKITANTYIVQKEDYLWEIALRAYGDGYRWVEIARSNNLVNPDFIHPGNVLKIPR